MLDTTSGLTSEVPITRRGAPAGPAVEHLTLTTQIQELALSPDGKKVAFIVRGEVFAASAKDGGDAARVTRTTAGESHIAWAPDSRRLAYASTRDGAAHIFLYDFATGAETQLTRGADNDVTPRFSPDGKMLAFQRGGRELRVIDLESKQDRVVAAANLEREPLVSDRSFAWSPDSRWIAFMPVSEKLFRNVFVAPAAGGQSRPISFLANSDSSSVSWSPDGTYVLFDTGQRTENFNLARVRPVAAHAQIQRGPVPRPL